MIKVQNPINKNKIIMEVIPHKDQRFGDVGDWGDDDGDWGDDENTYPFIRVSDMDNWLYERFLFIHELIEDTVRRVLGITETEVNESYKYIDPKLGADDPKSPNYQPHQIASICERIVCQACNIPWWEYGAAVEKKYAKSPYDHQSFYLKEATIYEMPTIMFIENSLFNEEEGRFAPEAYRWLIEKPSCPQEYLTPEQIEYYDINIEEQLLNAKVYLFRHVNTEMVEGKAVSCTANIGSGAIVVSRNLENKKVGRIYSIGILEEFRSKGYAKIFLKKMENVLIQKGCDILSLETHEDFKTWVDFLQREGYRIVECMKNYYDDGDAVRMEKKI